MYFVEIVPKIPLLFSALFLPLLRASHGVKFFKILQVINELIILQVLKELAPLQNCARVGTVDLYSSRSLISHLICFFCERREHIAQG